MYTLVYLELEMVNIVNVYPVDLELVIANIVNVYPGGPRACDS